MPQVYIGAWLQQAPLSLRRECSATDRSRLGANPSTSAMKRVWAAGNQNKKRRQDAALEALKDAYYLGAKARGVARGRGKALE